MAEPAKDEADLVQRVSQALHHEVYGGQTAWMDASKIERFYREMEAGAAIAAIRAAGWAVVPVEPTWKMIRVMDNYDDMMQDETTIQLWKDTLAAAPGVKP